ncbi:TolC family outer membrane protein [Prosthecomicrobium sp. N25]|uniref:TolC family outer membrane protein n=1 Tax=Prosthecomicrobium sp. N25 TaxID=3129254 RepID=UPI003077FAF3
MKVKRYLQSGVLALLMAGTSGSAMAQTLLDALSLAYSNNPDLNEQRSRTRSADENVNIALSGYRPQINLNASSVWTSSRTNRFTNAPGKTTPPLDVSADTSGLQRNIQLSLVQPIFSGFQTTNSVKQNEAAVLAQREFTRNTEQQILFDAGTAFMDVIRDTALVGLQETNVKFLTEQVRAARDRFAVGEGTRTDVAQAEARQQLAVSQLNSARAQANSSRARFRQVIGVEPGRLTGSVPFERLLPKNGPQAVDIAQVRHPAILAGVHNIDVASFNMKVIEGDLLPQVNLQGAVSRTLSESNATGSLQPGRTRSNTNNAQIGINVTVPIYQGGAEYARVRKAKEDLGTARIQLDSTRDFVRRTAIAAFGQYEAAGASIIAARAQVEAARLALNGVIEEQRVGQRTTLDVLNAQAELIDAQVNQVLAERNRVVAAFALTAAIGKLDAENLSLKVVKYDPVQHYDAVRDKWFGLRTPDGR